MEGSGRHRQVQSSTQEQTEDTHSRGPGVTPQANGTQMTAAGQPLPQTFHPPHLGQIDPAHLYYFQPSQDSAPPGAAPSHTSPVAAQASLTSGIFFPLFSRLPYPQYPPGHPPSHYGYVAPPYYNPFGGPSPNVAYAQHALNSQDHLPHIPSYAQALASASDHRARASGPPAPTMAHQPSAAEPPLHSSHHLTMGQATPPNLPERTSTQTQTFPLDVTQDPRLQTAPRPQARGSTSTDDCNRPVVWLPQPQHDDHRASAQDGLQRPQRPSAVGMRPLSYTSTFDLHMPPVRRTSNRRSFDSFQDGGSGNSSVEQPAETPPRLERRRRVERRPPQYAHQMAAQQMAAQQMQTHRMQGRRSGSSQRFAHPNTPTDKQILELRAYMTENRLLPPHIPPDDNTCGICTKEYATEKCDPTEDAENALLVPCPAKHAFGEWCILTWIRTCLSQRNVIACPKCRTPLVKQREKPAQPARRDMSREAILGRYGGADEVLAFLHESRALWEEDEDEEAERFLLAAEQRLATHQRRLAEQAEQRLADARRRNALQQANGHYTPSAWQTVMGETPYLPPVVAPPGNLASNQGTPSGPYMGTFIVDSNDPTTLPLARHAERERPAGRDQENLRNLGQALQGQQGRTAAGEAAGQAETDVEEEEEEEEEEQEEEEEEEEEEGEEYDEYDEDVLDEEDDSEDDETDIQV